MYIIYFVIFQHNLEVIEGTLYYYRMYRHEYLTLPENYFYIITVVSYARPAYYSQL